jgi:glycosyltransferase involved in cell wall biosynthesis
MTEKLPISVLIASCNDGLLIEDCLKSLGFCDEIILVDLESNDNSAEIASKYGAVIYQHKRVEMVEYLFSEYIPKLKNDWVMLIDPDERIDPELEADIRNFFKDIPADCGRINVPIVYYYKSKALKGTVWGGDKSGRLLIKQSVCNIGNNVHTAIQLKETYITYRIRRKGNNVDHHFWVQSYEQMLEKHKRYIEKEGKARYDKGERYTFIKAFKAGMHAFYQSYFQYKGYKDGYTGCFLSAFYAWYNWSAWQSLKHYQRAIKNG